MCACACACACVCVHFSLRAGDAPKAIWNLNRVSHFERVVDAQVVVVHYRQWVDGQVIFGRVLQFAFSRCFVVSSHVNFNPGGSTLLSTLFMVVLLIRICDY